MAPGGTLPMSKGIIGSLYILSSTALTIGAVVNNEWLNPQVQLQLKIGESRQ